MSRALPTAATLAEWVRSARARTLEIVRDLTDEQLFGPRLAIVNPLHWEIGHLAWFQERWALRTALGRAALRADGDALYDSAAIAHDTRWDLPLPSRPATLDYLGTIRDRVIEEVARAEARGTLYEVPPGGRRTGATPDLAYFVLLGIFHEDMHDEAFTYTRQTLGYSAPRFQPDAGAPARPDAGISAALDAGPCPGDVTIPGGTHILGSSPDEAFAFDNEKWAHEIEVAPFAIARAAVTQADFADFVLEGGYRRREFWTEAGWLWREAAGAERPLHWRPAGARLFERRDFDHWVPLEPHRPVLHVGWYEAAAWSRWAGRRLPTEAEWDLAASGNPGGPKRRFPWGDAPPDPSRANLDGFALGAVDVGAFPEGDSAFGCRQMIGNVWEWTATEFGPFPGFSPDPYAEYSAPFFSGHKILRGGCWATRGRLVHSAWRNFYEPHRNDVWAGFRTCAVR